MLVPCPGCGPLSLSRVSVNSLIKFRFDSFDNDGNYVGGFVFLTDDPEGNNFTQSMGIASDLQSGSSNPFIPVSTNDAVLMTVTSVPSTWAANSYVVRLILEPGNMTWQWFAEFDNPIFPFRFDGFWRFDP
jgi:hypothetical protein